MSRSHWLSLGAAAVLLLCASSALAQNRDNCFRMSQLQSTRADGDQRIYARVNVHDFYRIDLQFRCSSLPYADRGIVLKPAGGKDLICTPLDLDLKANNAGALEPCFIKSITRLTPEEAAAIPAKVRP